MGTSFEVFWFQIMKEFDLLPSGFYTFIRVTAVLGYFAAGAFIVGLVYKGFKKVTGEDNVKRYRLTFILLNIPLFFLFIYIFLLVFFEVRLGK